jgi:hypothetical protein
MLPYVITPYGLGREMFSGNLSQISMGGDILPSSFSSNGVVAPADLSVVDCPGWMGSRLLPLIGLFFLPWNIDGVYLCANDQAEGCRRSDLGDVFAFRIALLTAFTFFLPS